MNKEHCSQNLKYH